MDAPKFEWLVDCARLFMPNADRLGDPLEGSTPPGELEWWRREAANAETGETRRIIEYNRSFLSRMAKMLRDHYYVGCWHMNPHENNSMWGCYTKHPESVAVRTTYAALRQSLPSYVEMRRPLHRLRNRAPVHNEYVRVHNAQRYELRLRA